MRRTGSGSVSCVRPDSLGFHDRPSPIFIGAGSDPDIFVKRGGAEGLGLGFEVIEKGYVGTPLDATGAFWAAGITGSRGHFGVLSGLAFERQADGDFAKIPVGSVEYFELQIFILNRTGPSIFSSSASGKSSIRTGLISSELARALKERLQVTSGADTLSVLLAESMEITVLSCLTGLAFLASSMTWARLSLSMTVRAGRRVAGWVCCAAICSCADCVPGRRARERHRPAPRGHGR
jgi:hypothetical protein